MVDQIELIAAIGKELGRQKHKYLNARQMGAVINAANLIVAEMETPHRSSVPGEGLTAWLASDDAGMSSKYMAHILADGPKVEPAYPHDADDFGRCSRFLLAVTDRKEIAAMDSCGKIWQGLVTMWPVLEIAYKHKNFKTISRVLQLIEENGKADRRPVG